MPLAVDASPSTSGDIIGSDTSKTWSHTKAAGAGGLMYVAFGGFYNAASAPSAATYAAAALTKVADSGRSTGGDGAQLWRRASPATGANNAVLTVSTGTVGGAGGISFTGGDTTTSERTPATSTGSSTAPTLSATSAVGDIVIYAVAWDAAGGATATFDGTHTVIFNSTTGGEGRALAYKSGAASSTTVGPSLSVSTTWGAAAVAVIPAATAAGRKAIMTTNRGWW